MRHKNQLIAVSSCLLFLALSTLDGSIGPAQGGLSNKPVRFTVTDPSGNPIRDATVEASRHGPGNAIGKTDPDGEVILQLTREVSLHVNVSRDGYYDSGGLLCSAGHYMGPDNRLLPRELPDRFTVQLKPVLDPVELHRGRFRGTVPNSSRPLGFDLVANAWVHPFGSGSVTDIYFHFQDMLVSENEYRGTLTVSFPNPRDGIQPFTAPRPFSSAFGSNLAPPNRAPVSGYQPALSFSVSTSRQSAPAPDRNYLLRTRSRTDAAGYLRQACYGWIQGEIEFDPRGPDGPQLQFSYTFNADPDPSARSLESLEDVPMKP